MEFAGKKADTIEFSLLKTVCLLVIRHISFFPLDLDIFHLSWNQRDPELLGSPVVSPCDAFYQTPAVNINFNNWGNFMFL